jgi:serine/threonine-protein kinase
MASVWLARVRGKHGFEKLFAIKTILAELASDFRFQQMFLDEARISSQIEHPNVAQILDVGDEQGILYLVMEWVDGDSLSKLQRAVERRGGTIPYGISLRILADACGGLHAAHELRSKDGAALGVVHRDVSPQNILVSANGTSKVIDFGIAKARDRIAGDTSTGTLKGKVHYMAPEQALGEAVDRRADVWAAGAVLYHLVAGHPPYDGPNQLATLYLLTSKRPPPPLPASVPSSISLVLRKALSQDTATRYATAAELQSALEQAIAESGLGTTPAHVAAFCAEQLRDRIQSRKEALALALSAAAERARIQDMLKPTADDSLASHRIDGEVAKLVLARESASPDPVDTTPSAAEKPARLESASELGRAPPLSERSSPTLGADGSMTGDVPLTSTGRSRRRLTSLAAALAALAVFALALRLLLASPARRPPEPALLAIAAAAPPARPSEVPPAPPVSAPSRANGPDEATPVPAPTVSTLAPPPMDIAARSHPPVASNTLTPYRPADASPRAPVEAAAAASASALPASAATPSCDPPYEFNAAGNRVFKKECL